MNAIRARDKAKAIKAAAKVKATRAALAATQESGLALGEKPTKPTLGVKAESSSSAAMKTTPVTKVKSERRSERPPKQEPVVVTKKSKVPVSRGGQDAPPSIYKNGRIYFKINQMAFRVIRKFPVYSTERKIRWEGNTPTNAEWNRALDTIDEYKDA